VSPELEPEVIEEDGGDDPHSFAFIPQQIEADWHEKWGPLLEGFPLNILFAAIRNDAQTGQQSVVEVCYWPDLATFREDSERKELCYFAKPMNAYFVRVIFETKTGRWQTGASRSDLAGTLCSGGMGIQEETGIFGCDSRSDN